MPGQGRAGHAATRTRPYARQGHHAVATPHPQYSTGHHTSSQLPAWLGFLSGTQGVLLAVPVVVLGVVAERQGASPYHLKGCVPATRRALRQGVVPHGLASSVLTLARFAPRRSHNVNGHAPGFAPSIPRWQYQRLIFGSAHVGSGSQTMRALMMAWPPLRRQSEHDETGPGSRISTAA